MLNPNVREQKPHKTQRAAFGIQHSYAGCSSFDLLLTTKRINGTNVSPRKALRVQPASHSIVLSTYEPINAAAACWAQKTMKRFSA